MKYEISWTSPTYEYVEEIEVNYGSIEIEAKSEKEAIEIAKLKLDNEEWDDWTEEVISDNPPIRPPPEIDFIKSEDGKIIRDDTGNPIDLH